MQDSHILRGVAKGVLGSRDLRFNKAFLSKQPKISGENDMTICWVPSLWHSVTPALKNPGYAPDLGIAGIFVQEGYRPPPPSPKVPIRLCVQLDKQTTFVAFMVVQI